jgi:hypothetical protein
VIFLSFLLLISDCLPVVQLVLAFTNGLSEIRGLK